MYMYMYMLKISHCSCTIEIDGYYQSTIVGGESLLTRRRFAKAMITMIIYCILYMLGTILVYASILHVSTCMFITVHM